MARGLGCFVLTSCLILPLTTAADEPLVAENADGDRLELLEISPEPGDADGDITELKRGQRVTVNIRYTVKSVDNARVFVRPFADGKRIRKFAAHGAPERKLGTGVTAGWFRLTDESVVDEVRVRMTSKGDELVVLKIPARIKGAKPEPAGKPKPLELSPTEIAIREFLKEQGKLTLEEKFADALKKVEQALDNPAPNNVNAEVWRAHLESSQVQILCFIDQERASALALDHQPDHIQLLKDNMSVAEVVIPVLDTQKRMIASLVRDHPDAALTLIERLEPVLESPPRAVGQHVFAAIRSAKRSHASYRRSIERTKLHMALIGQPMPQWDVAGWANGDPLSMEDLKGQVVLLDFWAVWCGPCIATFPHLKQLDNTHGNQGLTIIGITREYGFEWDSEGKRTKRVSESDLQGELEMLKEFAAHHELTHRLGVVGEESKLHESLKVSGIPQAVLIDRRGKIRMIRVGSGGQNARELEQMIEKLLAE